MMVRKSALFFVAVALFIVVACSSVPVPANQQTNKIHAVVTFSVLSDLLHKVAGDLLEVTTLVGPGSDTHTFEPSPADNVALADSSLIFENGASFEVWLDDLYTASRSSARRINVSQGIELRELADEQHTGGDAHDEHEADPHLWHDVNNAMQMVKNIRDALVETDPNNTATYQKNTDEYLAQLQELDQWVVAEVAKLPPERRKLVTTHDTFGYFAERYGFEVVGTGMASLSTESAEPAAAEVVALIEQIKAESVPAIFIENVSNPELMQRIASEAGVEVAPPLYTDALGEPGSSGDTYIKMMRYNVTTIIDALNRDR